MTHLAIAYLLANWPVPTMVAGVAIGYGAWVARECGR